MLQRLSAAAMHSIEPVPFVHHGLPSSRPRRDPAGHRRETHPVRTICNSRWGGGLGVNAGYLPHGDSCQEHLLKVEGGHKDRDATAKLWMSDKLPVTKHFHGARQRERGAGFIDTSEVITQSLLRHCSLKWFRVLFPILQCPASTPPMEIILACAAHQFLVVHRLCAGTVLR